jgi:hypothetical protein
MPNASGRQVRNEMMYAELAHVAERHRRAVGLLHYLFNPRTDMAFLTASWEACVAAASASARISKKLVPARSDRFLI